MPDFPDRHEQIRRVHADFIRQVVESCATPDQRQRFDALMAQAAQHGWTDLVAVLRRIASGERGQSLFSGLDEEDQIITDAILKGLQDPCSLPDPAQHQDPTLAAPGLAHMIHAAGTGNAQALLLVGNMAEQMSSVGGPMARLAATIRPMINGERNPDRLTRGMDGQGRQLVLDMLDELARLDQQ